MDEVNQICFLFLAPLSIISELFLIYAFWKLNQFKDHPEIMIFWQCFSQIILDLHWLTGVKTIHSALSPTACLFFGSFSIYFYYLSWDYTLLLSIEILLKIRNPHVTGYKKRRIWYHLVSHLSSLTIFLIIMLNETNAQSLIGTCFVQKYSRYEFIILLPALIHFPLSMGIISYALYITYNTYYSPYLKYHMMVAGTFFITWVPVALIHGLSFGVFYDELPEWFLFTAVILGALSGVLVFVARTMQKGILGKVFYAVFMPKKLRDEMMIKFNAPDVDDEESIESYSELFIKVTNSGIRNIIIALINVMESSQKNRVPRNSTRQWTFSVMSIKKVKVTHFHVSAFERIMKNFNISYSDIIKSFRDENDFKDIEERIKCTGGRSGAFFYFTADGEFILKTITSEELQVMGSIVDSYSERICSNSGSFLAKVFSVFKIKFDNNPSTILMIMENLTSKLEKPLLFDMKGSSKDRQVLFNKASHLSELPRDVVYKDVDFIENVESFAVSKKTLEDVVETIRMDTKMLRKQMIMDYSLLVAVEDSKYLRETIVEKDCVQNYDGLAVFIGIIDFLQRYNFKKKIESRYKNINGESLHSAIPPGPYRHRFVDMIKCIFRVEPIN